MLNTTKPLTQDQLMTCIDPNGVTVEYKSFQQWSYAILMLNNRGHWVVYKVGDSDFITPIWNAKSAGFRSAHYALRSFTAKAGA